MVDRVESLAPPELRLLMVKGLAGLAQVDAAKLPEGARAIMQDSYATGAFPAFASGAPGNWEFIFTRQALAAAMTFTPNAAGASVNSNGNALLAKGGGIWVRNPQLFRVTLNGTTPQIIQDVVNQVGGSSNANTDVMASIIRNVAGASPGHVTIIATIPAANRLQVVSSDAADNGTLNILLWPWFQQR